MASFETRGNSTRAIVRLPGGGKKTKTCDTLAEAQAWAAEIEGKKQAGVDVTTMGKTVEDLLLTYLDFVASKMDSGRWNSLRLLKWASSPIGKEKLQTLTPHRMNQWMAERGRDQVARGGGHRPVSGSTVNREMNLWAAAFTYGVKSLKWIAMNPCHGATRPPPSPSRNRPLLTWDEMQAISIAGGYNDEVELATRTQRVVAGFFFALETGMRSGEILRLRPADFDKVNRVVKVSATEVGGRKGSRSGQVDSSRVVPLTPRAAMLLTRLLATMPSGQQPVVGFSKPPYIMGMNDTDRDALWRRVRRLSGVADLNFHDTKHEACTRLAKFLDVFELSHAVGTKDIALLRDTYYVSNAVEAATRLPDSLTPTTR
jgi:integrase